MNNFELEQKIKENLICYSRLNQYVANRPTEYKNTYQFITPQHIEAYMNDCSVGDINSVFGPADFLFYTLKHTERFDYFDAQ